ncbi:MAG: hypothetical protein Q8S84_03705 [bacterium]|nr:hypothetical protein [bacterium]MDP3380626.1 hypothetical protein [bacterium]
MSLYLSFNSTFFVSFNFFTGQAFAELVLELFPVFIDCFWGIFCSNSSVSVFS